MKLQFYGKDIFSLSWLAEKDPSAATQCRRHSKRTQSSSQEDKTGLVYPVDLWYLLSGYVHPEHVQKFALLCRDSYETTKKYQFWRNMYKR